MVKQLGFNRDSPLIHFDLGFDARRPAGIQS
mgnify:CR=1 FL=1